MSRLVLSVLAVYRLSHMLAREDGPFDALAGLRERVGQSTWVGRGLHCLYCSSFWAALLIRFIPDWALIWLAVAGGVLLADKAVNRE